MFQNCRTNDEGTNPFKSAIKATFGKIKQNTWRAGSEQPVSPTSSSQILSAPDETSCAGGVCSLNWSPKNPDNRNGH